MNSCQSIEECLTRPHIVKQIKEISEKLESRPDISSTHICKIRVNTREFDWVHPPNKNKGNQSSGTGFVCSLLPPARGESRVYILTCAHVVRDSVQINLNFAALSSEFVNATIVGVNADMDVAIIAIDDENISSAIWMNRETLLKVGKSDGIRQGTSVTAHGFAMGDPQIQVTQGILSARVDNPSRLQTDAPVNPGNSGGPLFNEDMEVIGIVTSGRTDANGIFYSAPIMEVSHIVARIMGKYAKQGAVVVDFLPNLNCFFTKCNKTLVALKRNQLGKESQCSSGVFVASVHPAIEYPQSRADAIKNLERKGYEGPLKDILSSADVTTDSTLSRSSWSLIIARSLKIFGRDVDKILSKIRNDTLTKGDIICCLKDQTGKTYDVDLQMTCSYDNIYSQKIGFLSILDRMDYLGIDGQQNHLEVQVLRDGVADPIWIQAPLHKNLNVFRNYHPSFERISYAVLGGIFVMPLTLNHTMMWQNQKMNSNLPLMYRPGNRHESILIVTHVLPESPFEDREAISAGDILVSCNNKQTVDMHTLKAAFEDSDQDLITIELRDGSIASAKKEAIQRKNFEIASIYNDEYVGFHTTTPHSAQPPAKSASEGGGNTRNELANDVPLHVQGDEEDEYEANETIDSDEEMQQYDSDGSKDNSEGEDVESQTQEQRESQREEEKIREQFEQSKKDIEKEELEKRMRDLQRQSIPYITDVVDEGDNDEFSDDSYRTESDDLSSSPSHLPMEELI